MMHAASARGRLLDAFVVRKAGKAHGLQRRIEGPDVAGRRVLAVEDTSTTGGSVLTAVDALLEAGAEVAGVAVVVDRGARARIAERGLPYRAAYERADLALGCSPPGRRAPADGQGMQRGNPHDQQRNQYQHHHRGQDVSQAFPGISIVASHKARLDP